jgi:hypothetical protein
MRRIAICLLMIVLVLIVWGLWSFQPWVKPGHASLISSCRIGEHDIQIWQRKNEGLTEPFATGLFVRSGTNWLAFCLDFQDLYHPSIKLQNTNTGIAVFRSGDRLGTYDAASGMFLRAADGAKIAPVTINSPPPGNWWLRP